MRKILFILSILLLLTLSSGSLANEETDLDLSKSKRKMAEAITAEQLKDYLYFVASDAMGGRDTPSSGLDITAQFLALNLKRWGFKPAGDNGTFFQMMDVRKDSVDVDNTKLFIGSKELIFGKDFQRFFAGEDVLDAPLVFVKDGWIIKSKGIDAYRGVDIKDKILVVYTDNNPTLDTLTPRPKEITYADLIKMKKGEDWFDPITYANQKGAKGLILVASQGFQKHWSGITPSAMHLEKLYDYEEKSLPVLLVSQEVGEMIFANESGDQNSTKAFDIKKSAKIKTENKTERISTQNVVALWEGSDPKLKAEMVAVGSHYDAQGIRERVKYSSFVTFSNSQTQILIPFSPRTNVSEDTILNGADDDGSGTVATLAIAEALAKAKKRPKRSILLVWHAGEEKGLWGSKYFNKYPTVNINNVIAQLNMDMIGRSREKGDKSLINAELSESNEVYVIGSKVMSTELGNLTKEVNNSYLNMNYNYKYDAPDDPNGFFYRSDHYSYAKNGIPVVFWFSGTHMNYHSATDSADKIDYEKLENVARTVFLTMWELAELKKRPKVDKPLPAR